MNRGEMKMLLLKVEDLSKSYETESEKKALDDVSFVIEEGECLGLVGESGCGKSTLARCLLKIESIDHGSIFYKGEAIEQIKGRKVRPYRKEVQAVFQNPSASLNPKLKIKDSLIDPYLQFQEELQLSHFSFTSVSAFIDQLLESVELPSSIANCYPHELSGGQKQRVTIARAISIEPKLLILDEPTASLDVLTQGAILNLLTEIRKRIKTAYLFISHDLAAVHQISDNIMVMETGKIVDSFAKVAIFEPDRSAYTKHLVELFD